MRFVEKDVEFLKSSVLKFQKSLDPLWKLQT